MQSLSTEIGLRLPSVNYRAAFDFVVPSRRSDHLASSVKKSHDPAALPADMHRQPASATRSRLISCKRGRRDGRHGLQAETAPGGMMVGWGVVMTNDFPAGE